MGAAFTRPARFIPAPVVIETTALVLGTTVEQVRSKRITRSLTGARQIATLLLLEFTMLSRAEIATALGRTVTGCSGFYLANGAKLRLGKDEVFATALQQVRERLLQGDHV